MQDLTCADATGISYSIALSLCLPLICRGARPPSSLSITAPIDSKGLITRFIGREHSELSPTRRLSNDWPASNPSKSRIAVPELPISRSPSALARPCRPTPCTTTRSPSRSILTPSCCIAWIVLRLSSPCKKPEMWLSPSAMAASITARCDIDLSPGTRIEPLTPVPGLQIK